MDGPLIAARAVHFAAQISLTGILRFIVTIAAPAYAQAGTTLSDPLRRRLALLAWASLALALLSAVPWLLLVARSMSGESLMAVLSQGIVYTALLHTQFGHALAIDAGMLLVLIPLIVQLGTSRKLDELAALLAAAGLATIAWQGHAGAEEGFEGIIHAGADVVHLVAAGLWIGALLPLALLLKDARSQQGRRGGIVAQTASIAFSDLGLACVSALLITGALNAWLLVGSVPALFGTLYGQLLLLKLSLFAVMLILAAVNRQRLLPRLATADHGRKATASQAAVRAIERNALLEACIGLGVVMIVAALGTLTPGAHEQPWWPFPYRLGFDAIEAVPELRNDAIGTAALALLGFALVGFGWGRKRKLLVATGLVLVLGLGWRPIELIMIPATPTSYYQSAEPYTVKSIIAGGKLYAENCVECHGRAGLGDGPLAAELPLAPADLTTHLSVHRDGDLYWFITAGMDGGVMPPFAASFDETQRWEIIAALRAHAATAELEPLSADVTTEPAPLAPDFSFAAEDGTPSTLKALLARDAVLLLFPGAPGSAFAARFEASRSILAESGVAILTVTDDPDVRSVYAFYDPGHPRRGTEPFPTVAFLIDRNGYIRASWHPGDLPDWQNIETLQHEIAAAGRLRLAPAAASVHVHSPS